MQVTLWGTRGSLATPDMETMRMGGNTSCVEVEGENGTVLVLDAGTGIRRLGQKLVSGSERMDILLTHLHMDHIQGLGFFAPIFKPGVEIHIWGPPSTIHTLEERLGRYLSPPLFPVYLRDAASQLHLHDLTGPEFEIGPFHIESSFICHPNPTVGYRITEGGSIMAYLPDHEPALGGDAITSDPEWTSGYTLAEGADLLIHDAMYTDQEYSSHKGWGHSSMRQAFDFAALASVDMLVPFHHDPSHTDRDIDRIVAQTLQEVDPAYTVVPGAEGTTFVLDRGTIDLRRAPGPNP